MQTIQKADAHSVDVKNNTISVQSYSRSRAIIRATGVFRKITRPSDYYL